MLLVIAMAAALAGAEPATVPAPAAATAPEAGKSKAEKPKKVCVEEAQMGSLFKKRICATPEEWERRRVLDQEAMARNGGKVPGSCTGVAC